MIKKAGIGLSTLFLWSLVWAGPPPGVTYSNFSATAGVISAPCPTNYSCKPISEGVGFVQREIVQNSGLQDRYIQTITVDPNVTGTPDQLPMVIESFVQASQSGGTTTTVNGFSGRETSLENSADSSFSAVTSIDNGWAEQAGVPNVRVQQDISNNQPLGEHFTDHFQYQANHLGNGQDSGASLNIDQGVGLLDGGNGGPDDQQVYSYRHLEGDMNPNAGSLTLPNGSVLSWSAGDSITYQQAAQTMAPTGTTELDFPGSFVQFDFAENLTTNTQVRSTIQQETGTISEPNPPFPSAP